MYKLSQTQKRMTAGFTLMELLVVMVILVILLAFLVPTVMKQFRNLSVNQTELQIGTFDRCFEEYNAEKGDYPRVPTLVAGNEDLGLQYLLGIPMQTQQLPGQGGVMPGDPNNPAGPGNFGQPGIMPGNEFGAGQGGFGNPSDPFGPPAGGSFGEFGATPLDATRGGAGGGGDAIMPPAGPGAFDTGANPDGAFGPTSGVGGGADMTTPGTVPMGGAPVGGGVGFNPNVGSGGKNYYHESVIPLDPWKNKYRYEYPSYRRPDMTKPAIWSAGPDGIDGTADDVINWKPDIDALKNDPAAQARFDAQKQRISSATGPTGPGGPVGPGGPGTANPFDTQGQFPGNPMTGPDGMPITTPPGTGFDTMPMTTPPGTGFDTMPMPNNGFETMPQPQPQPTAPPVF